MKRHDFRNRVCQFNFVDKDAFLECGGLEHNWPNFRKDPLQFWISAGDIFQQLLWSELEEETKR